jgi:putative lipoic acid-binding regulatory protein
MKKNKVQIKVSKDFENKVNYTCSKIQDNEWAGILIYSLKGSIRDTKSLVIILEDMFPIKKDTATNFQTEYPKEFDRYWANCLQKDNKKLKWQLGLIHSHCNMGVFFSGGDTDELVGNNNKYKFYLSVVVNNYQQMVGKIYIPLQASELIGIDEDGIPYSIKTDAISKYSGYLEYDCKFPEKKVALPNKDFVKQVKNIIKLAEPKTYEPNLFNRSGESPYNSYGIENSYPINNHYIDNGTTDDDKLSNNGIEDMLDEMVDFPAKVLNKLYHMFFKITPTFNKTFSDIQNQLTQNKYNIDNNFVNVALSIYKDFYPIKNKENQEDEMDALLFLISELEEYKKMPTQVFLKNLSDYLWDSLLQKTK